MEPLLSKPCQLRVPFRGLGSEPYALQHLLQSKGTAQSKRALFDPDIFLEVPSLGAVPRKYDKPFDLVVPVLLGARLRVTGFSNESVGEFGYDFL